MCCLVYEKYEEAAQTQFLSHLTQQVNADNFISHPAPETTVQCFSPIWNSQTDLEACATPKMVYFLTML